MGVIYSTLVTLMGRCGVIAVQEAFDQRYLHWVACRVDCTVYSCIGNSLACMYCTCMHFNSTMLFYVCTMHHR